VPNSVKNTTFVILGDDQTRRAWFRDRGLIGSSMPTELSRERHMVLVWDPAKLSEEERESAAQLCRFAAENGRIVVLSTTSWRWPQLCNVEVDRMSGSRVFPYERTSPTMLRGIDLECLKRWNGLPGTVAAASLKGPAVESSKRVLWVREPKHTVVAEVPAATGGGSVLFSQLDLRRRVLRSAPSYDPVAEQLLINLLSD
jgi:hypothetical protein